MKAIRSILISFLACTLNLTSFAMDGADQSLKVIACEIAKRIIKAQDTSLLNKITDLPTELFSFILLELKKQSGSVFANLFTKIIVGNNRDVTAAIFSMDKTLILVGFRDGTARLYDLSTLPETFQNLNAHTNSIASVDISSDRRYAITGSLDNTACLWNLNNLQAPPIILRGHTDRVSCVEFSHDCQFVLTGSFDGTARLWDLRQAPVASQMLHGHNGPINSIAFNNDSSCALTGGQDSMVCLWELTKSPITCINLSGHQAEVTSVAFSPDCSYALTGSADNTVCLWNLLKDPIENRVFTLAARINRVRFSPNGGYALAISNDNNAYLWHLEEEANARVLSGHTARIISISISADEEWAITGSCDGTVRLWYFHETPVFCTVISPDDSWQRSLELPVGAFVAGSYDNPVWRPFTNNLNIFEIFLLNKLQEAKAANAGTDNIYREILSDPQLARVFATLANKDRIIEYFGISSDVVGLCLQAQADLE